ncbi:hypothetical protein C8J56DRAFT_1167899 [Mycena floridula]|nr:hypothetical protein C8J56DRAFT_1167899 [Mycena floridula]
MEFLRFRAIVFCVIALVSFLWVVLLSIVLALQSEFMDRSEESLIGVMLFTDSTTLLMILVLLILPFRAWLDAARMILLLLFHIGTAAFWTVWDPKFKCPTQSTIHLDHCGICLIMLQPLTNLASASYSGFYILLASWVIPILLTVYTVGLAIMLCRRSPLDQTSQDIEANTRKPQMRQLDTTPKNISGPLEIVSPVSSPIRTSDTLEDSRFSTSTGRSARLSKPFIYPM